LIERVVLSLLQRNEDIQIVGHIMMILFIELNPVIYK